MKIRSSGPQQVPRLSKGPQKILKVSSGPPKGIKKSSKCHKRSSLTKVLIEYTFIHYDTLLYTSDTLLTIYN